MLNCLAVGIGGFLGSVLRYLMTMIPIKENTTFPINTLMINILGAFIIGCVISIFSKNIALDGRLLLFIKVGFCGGLTTFSTFSSETLTLIESGSWLLALAYVMLSVILGVLAVFIGQYIFIMN